MLIAGRVRSLECRLSDRRQGVIGMEERWKDKLLSRKFGFNRN
jgi:hypothetical protein